MPKDLNAITLEQLNKMFVNIVILITLINIISNQVQAYNILAVILYPGKSHYKAFQPLLNELAKRGHNMTCISHYTNDKPIENFHTIRLSKETQDFQNWIPVKNPTYWSIIKVGIGLPYVGALACNEFVSNKDILDLEKNGVKFDVMLVELFNTNCPLGLAYKLGVPVVGMTCNSLLPHQYRPFDIPDNPAYTSNAMLGGGSTPTLFQRVERTIVNFYYNYVVRYLFQYLDDYYLWQIYGDIPSTKELEKNIKMLLLYQNFILNRPQLLPSNVIEVAGHHIVEPLPLPINLKKFIEESKYGVIYISFGSMVKAASFPNDKLNAILEVLMELPQRVIWKWDSDTLPFQVEKIYSAKWLPQNDIMAHPKLLAFFSHCGQSGVVEAIHYGVPIVGMPMFGDQVSNAASIEESGIGLQTTLDEVTKEKLLHMFKTVLDSKFRQNVKTISKMFRDRPISALDTAVFWTEFVARYPNITYRSPYMDMAVYKYYCIDVICISLLFLSIALLLVKKIFFLVCFIFKSKVKRD